MTQNEIDEYYDYMNAKSNIQLKPTVITLAVIFIITVITIIAI